MEIKNTFNLLYSFWHMLPINISMTRHILKQHLPLSMMSQTDINVIFIQKLRADNFIISLSSSNLNLIKYIKTCMHTQHISYLYPINNKHLKSKSTIRVVCFEYFRKESNFNRWQVIRSLSWEDPLEKEMVTHSSILAWRIPWAVQPLGSQSRTRLSDFHFHFSSYQKGIS